MRKRYTKRGGVGKASRKQRRKRQAGENRTVQLVLDREELVAMMQDSLTDFATEMGLKVASLLLEDEVHRRCGSPRPRAAPPTFSSARAATPSDQPSSRSTAPNTPTASRLIAGSITLGGGSNAIVLGNGAAGTITANQNATLNLSAGLFDNGYGMLKSGTATLSLTTASPSLTGLTTVAQGTLALAVSGGGNKTLPPCQ